MHCAVYQSTESYACVPMDSEESQHKDAQSPNAPLTSTAKSISAVRTAAVGIHVYK